MQVPGATTAVSHGMCSPGDNLGAGEEGQGCCSSRAFVPAGRRAFPVHRRLWEGKNKEFLGRGLARGRLELAGCQGKRPAGLRGNMGSTITGLTPCSALRERRVRGDCAAQGSTEHRSQISEESKGPAPVSSDIPIQLQTRPALAGAAQLRDHYSPLALFAYQ